jgi:outer membrane protein insertion porin family
MKFKPLVLLCLCLSAIPGAMEAYAQVPDSLPADPVRINYPMMDYNNPKRYVIRDIRLHGTVTHFEPEVLISTSGMQRGDTVMLPGDYLSAASRRLWGINYFSDIETRVTTEGDSAWIDIYLTQRPQVFQWLYNGVRRGEVSELEEKLRLRRGVELSDFRINTAIGKIKAYFHEKGYRNVAVQPVIKTDTTAQSAVSVTFDVDRGQKVKIGAVDFTGNRVFSDRRLRRTLKKTRQKGINFLLSSKFKEAQYAEDQAAMIDFYNARGYRNATVVADSIYAISDNRIGIRLTVDEGNKFYYRNITWMGNSVYPTAELSNLLGIQKGDTYDRKAMDRQLGIRNEADPMKFSITSLYQNNGYLTSQIDPQEIVVGTDSLDLEIKIIEGKQVTVNSIVIKGNTQVYDHVIRRELDVRPGELYNRALLMSTISRLSQMNHFTAESSAAPQFDLVGNDLLNLTFPLEEQASDQFELSGGWGAGMFMGSIGLTLNNFSLRNALKKWTWPYPHGENQQLSLRAQTNGQYYKSFSMSFTDPWFGGKKPNSLSVGLYYSDQTDAMYVWQPGNKHFRTIGGSLGIGRRLKWPDYMFSLYNEVSYQAYNLKDWDGFLGFSNGTANIVTLRTMLGRNTIDDQMYPTTGSNFSLGVTLTPPYSLFDGNNYAGTGLTQKERYNWIEFHKWDFNADWYYPLKRGKNQLVLRAHAEMGFIGSYNKHKVSPFEGFEVGGDGMSGYDLYGVDVIGLRGYQNGSLSPTNAQSQAYHKYTLEMRYPFIRQGQTLVYGLAFAEAGNAFDRVRDFDPFQVKRSVGAGVRLYLPVVGWIGIDYAYGFDRDRNGQKGGGMPHFIIGQTF